MSKLKRIGGKELLKIFSEFGFNVASRKGSHIKLARETKERKQVMIIPDHKELDKGTLSAIYRQALRYIPEEDLTKYFYN